MSQWHVRAKGNNDRCLALGIGATTMGVKAKVVERHCVLGPRAHEGHRLTRRAPCLWIVDPLSRARGLLHGHRHQSKTKKGPNAWTGRE